jgi:hypothetical protein
MATWRSVPEEEQRQEFVVMVILIVITEVFMYVM